MGTGKAVGARGGGLLQGLEQGNEPEQFHCRIDVP